MQEQDSAIPGLRYEKDFYLRVHIESADPLDRWTLAKVQEILREHYAGITVSTVPIPAELVKDRAAEQRVLALIREAHEGWHGREDGIAYLRPLGTIRPCEVCGCLVSGGRDSCECHRGAQ